MANDEFHACIAAVLERQIEDFRSLIAVDRLSGGASQETYRIELETTAGRMRLALRRAPGGHAVVRATGYPGLETEAELLRAAAAAGVPVPSVRYVLAPDDGLGAGFLMQWLEGETLGARIARAPEFETLRPRLAYECGQILARLHAIDLDATGLRARLDVVTPETFVRQTWERYQSYNVPQPMIDYTARWLLDHLPQAAPSTLVHNDFRNGNLMIHPEHGVVAVLDWEMAHIGDPMRDLGWICTSSWRFGRPDLPVGGFGHDEDLFRGYESVSGRPVDRDHVRFWEVFGSFWWAVGCLTMADIFRRGPDRSVERAAIGRRSSECQADCANLLIPGPVRVVEPEPPLALELPRVDELLGSVRDLLRNDLMGATSGRLNFMARVAANALDIVAREIASGRRAYAQEHDGLRALFGSNGDLTTLRWRLVHELRDGSLPLDWPGLAAHLRATVINRLAIEQPRYPALNIALTAAAPDT
jgi:aminoglycoside phosphotransferase (APT) family kinase protein